MSNRLKDPAFVYLLLRVGSSSFFSVLATTNLVYQIQVARFGPLQPLLVGAILELTCLASQVPTGLLADAFSRRAAVVIGLVLVGVGFLIEGLFPTFAAIAVAQGVWGLGATLADGADDAWITDEVGEARAAELFLRGSQVAQAAALVGVIAGVGLAAIRLNLPLLVGGGLHILLGALLFVLMTEAAYSEARLSPASARGMVAGARSTWRLVRARPLIVTILAITVVFGLSGEGVDRLYAIHLIADIGLGRVFGLPPVLWFGVLAVGSALLGFTATSILRAHLDLGDHRLVTRALLAFTTVRVIRLAGFALAPSLLVAIGCLWVASTMRHLFQPVQRAWLNRSLDPRHRATLFPVDGQADALGQVLGGPVLGFLAAGVSIRAGLLGSAALLGVALPLFARAGRQTTFQVPNACDQLEAGRSHST